VVVGGYFGGLLAKAYAESDQFEIVFIARGETKSAIRSGLKIITDENEITVFQILFQMIPNNRKLDYLICATKHDIEESSFVKKMHY
jgi:2-dehydropantoate 2-reductase